MGIGAWWHWVVVLIVVLLVFGTKKLKNIGGDVGGAVKSFKDAMKEEGAKDKVTDETKGETIESEANEKTKSH